MKEKYLLIALVIGMICGVVGYIYFGSVQKEKSYMSFEEAIECSRKERTKPERWAEASLYRLVESKSEYSFKVYRKDNITGYFLYRASNGTLFEAEYPSGKIGKAHYMIIAPNDTEEYYVWEIIDLSEHIPYVHLGKQIWIDARNGEILLELPAGKRGPKPTATPVEMISFGEAVEFALKGGEPKWKFSEYRRLGEFEGEPFVTPDGLAEGHLEWLASNGTLYEAEYPSGKVRGEVEHFTGVEDTEEYYVWKIILMDGKSCHVDARNGELLSLFPSRVPGLLTFKTAVRIVYAPQKRIEEWRVQEYKRIGDFESKPYETPDGLVKGHLLWRISNGTLCEVMPPFIRQIIGKVLYIEVPDDREEYNVWEIATEDKVYYIDARNGIVRLILGETPVPPPTKLLPAYTLNITFPSKPLTVRKGESVTLPVAIKSWVDDEPIRIRLALVSSPDREVPLPEFITYEVEEYITVNPHETVHTQMIIKVSEDALPGEYSITITGELQEPIEGYSGIAYTYSLVVEA